jgi:hypothetical protein
VVVVAFNRGRFHRPPPREGTRPTTRPPVARGKERGTVLERVVSTRLVCLPRPAHSLPKPKITCALADTHLPPPEPPSNSQPAIHPVAGRAALLIPTHPHTHARARVKWPAPAAASLRSASLSGRAASPRPFYPRPNRRGSRRPGLAGGVAEGRDLAAIGMARRRR